MNTTVQMLLDRIRDLELRTRELEDKEARRGTTLDRVVAEHARESGYAEAAYRYHNKNNGNQAT